MIIAHTFHVVVTVSLEDSTLPVVATKPVRSNGKRQRAGSPKAPPAQGPRPRPRPCCSYCGHPASFHGHGTHRCQALGCDCEVQSCVTTRTVVTTPTDPRVRQQGSPA